LIHWFTFGVTFGTVTTNRCTAESRHCLITVRLTVRFIMWHHPVWSIVDGSRSRAVADIDFLLRKAHRSTDFQCLSMGRTSPQIAPFCGESRPPSNAWFLESPPNGISIGSAVFAGLMKVGASDSFYDCWRFINMFMYVCMRPTELNRHTNHAIPSVA